MCKAEKSCCNNWGAKNSRIVNTFALHTTKEKRRDRTVVIAVEEKEKKKTSCLAEGEEEGGEIRKSRNKGQVKEDQVQHQEGILQADYLKIRCHGGRTKCY